jgi:hypothetical protein
MQWMNQIGMLKISHQARVKFSIGNYVDAVDCAVVPLSACHLLLGKPWQFDLDVTHRGHSNNFSFIHKVVSHVFKPTIKSTIMVVSFPTLKKEEEASSYTDPKVKDGFGSRRRE